jgi:hypothetical protein
VLTLTVASGDPRAQSVRPAPVGKEAVSAILDLYQQYSIVALSEGPHNNQKGHELRMALVRHPRFATLVDDVVVEFGNSRYQALMDRFTSGGEVPYQELRHVWEDTTMPGPIWDSPIYAEFLNAIRDVNRTTGAHVRVLLGDPPIDWSAITSGDQVAAYYPQRSPHAASVIEEEVVRRNRRALVIYGEGHVMGRHNPRADTLVSILTLDTNARIFTISNRYPDLSRFRSGSSWPIPGLVFVQGTTLGAEPYGRLNGEEPRGVDPPLEWDFDAVLDLGGPAALSMTGVRKDVCKDPDYLKMRFARFALTASPGGPDPAGELRQLCAN